MAHLQSSTPNVRTPDSVLLKTISMPPGPVPVYTVAPQSGEGFSDRQLAELNSELGELGAAVCLEQNPNGTLVYAPNENGEVRVILRDNATPEGVSSLKTFLNSRSLQVRGENDHFLADAEKLVPVVEAVTS